MISRSTATPKLALLASPIYLSAIAALVLNDFLLKRCWAGVITGKLSDFCGLFALAVAMLVICRSSWVLVLVAACFAFWKSPFSEGVIQFCNAATGIGIGRTVDLTDLAALAVLPLSLLYYRSTTTRVIPWRWGCAVSSIISLFAFAATAQVVDDQHFALLYDAYLGDDAVRDFMAAHNPAALAETRARFREAVERGLWRPVRNSIRAELMRDG